MDVVFLDANVLFSAAYREASALGRLWSLENAQLVTSTYALEEARTNLEDTRQQERLERLCTSLLVVGETPDRPLPKEVQLPQKDRPILAAAIDAGATHLLTGDVAHFGPYYGRRVGGVLILRPAAYLRGRGR